MLGEARGSLILARAVQLSNPAYSGMSDKNGLKSFVTTLAGMLRLKRR